MNDFSLLAWYHLVGFGILVPFLAIRTSGRVTGPAAPPLDRMKHFQSTTMTLVAFGVFSWLVARRQHFALFSVDLGTIARVVPAGLAMYVAAVVFMRPRWRRAVEKRARIVYLFMPSNATERAWWLTVSILAGVSEELTWRGVQTALLTEALGSGVVAAIVCAVTFGVAHYMQGWKSMLIVAVFALGFQGLVWLSGSLHLAMAVHTAYDITAGLTYGRLGRQLGYQLPDSRELSSSPPHAPGTSL